MALYKNINDKQVLVQRAGPANDNVYHIKLDMFAPQGDYTCAMYDENNNYIGRSMDSNPVSIDPKDFHGYKKPFLASKFKGTILFIKGSLDKMTERVVIQPKETHIKIRINGVDQKIPLVGNIVLKVGVNFPSLAKLLNEIGVLRKRGDDQGICMTLNNYLTLVQMVVDRLFQTCVFTDKVMEGSMSQGESGQLFNLFYAPGNEMFAKIFRQAFNDTAERMKMPAVHCSAIGG